MRAAVFVEQDAPFAIEDVALHPSAPTTRSSCARAAPRSASPTATCSTGTCQVAPPAILGHSAVGVVERAGPRVERVRVGERVIVPATPGMRPLLPLPAPPLRPVRAARGGAAALVGTLRDGSEVRAGGTATYAEQIKVPEGCSRSPSTPTFPTSSLR